MEECKYEIKKNKIENLINDDLDLSSSDNESDNDESDNESDSEMMLRLTMMKIFNLFHQPYI